MKKIIGVYKITNTITGDFYIGSSKNVKQRWACHKCPSVWKEYPNKQIYKDMLKYGVDSFELQILEEAEIEHLKEKEQQFIENLKPTYNNYNAKGWNIERLKKYKKEYEKSNKYKDYQKQYQNKYNNQLCLYNSEIIKLNTLATRFCRAGVEHPTIEAKKYIIKN